jgi:hypothetical protein
MKAAQEEVVARFPFRNAGTQPIQIKAVKSFCGCTTVSLEKKEFAPGETGEIVATYVPGPRMGTQRNIITVQTDFAGEEKSTLTVAAEIPVVAKLERPFLLWAENEARTPKTLGIITIGKDIVEGIAIRAADPTLQVQVEQIDDTSYRLRVTPTKGEVSSSVILEASLAGNQKKRFSAYVRVR